MFVISGPFCKTQTRSLKYPTDLESMLYMPYKRQRDKQLVKLNIISKSNLTLGRY